MNVQFGTTTNDVAVINKKADLGPAIDCQVKIGTSVENPTIIVKQDSIDPTDNYAYIEKFGRYYFIGDKTFTTGNRVEVELNVDPLYSFAKELNECEFYIDRIGTMQKRAAYVSDSNYPMSTQTTTENILFSDSPFDTSEVGDPNRYVLTVIGGNRT